MLYEFNAKLTNVQMRPIDFSGEGLRVPLKGYHAPQQRVRGRKPPDGNEVESFKKNLCHCCMSKHSKVHGSGLAVMIDKQNQELTCVLFPTREEMSSRKCLHISKGSTFLMSFIFPKKNF